MPTYCFKNKETGEIIEKFLKISELDNFKKENPNLETVLNSFYYGGIQDLKHKHIDDGFKEVLGRIRNNGLVGSHNNIDKWL